MIPSRKLAAIFFCVFVLGAVVGGLLVYDTDSMSFSKVLARTNDPDSLAQRIDQKLAAKYQLDSDEQARIAPITRDLAQNLFQIRQKFGSDVMTTLDAAHAKIAAQMTPAQRDAYLKDVQAKRQQHAAMLLPASAPAPH